MLKPWIFSCETNDFVDHRTSRNSRNSLYLLPFFLSKNPLGASWAHCNMIFVGFSSIPWLLMQPTIKIDVILYIYIYRYVCNYLCHYLRMLYYHHYRCDVKATCDFSFRPSRCSSQLPPRHPTCILGQAYEARLRKTWHDSVPSPKTCSFQLCPVDKKDIEKTHV